MNRLAIGLLLVLFALSSCPLRAQEAFVRRSVVEEFTGTWCGNCPRGIVGMQRLAEDFGDRFIGIAIHIGVGEPMLIPTYPDVQTDLMPGSGAPCCAIDRVKFKFDPYAGSGRRGYNHYGIDQDFAAALNVPTEAKVELTAQWDDEYQWDVRFNVVTTFNIDSPTAPYRLVLVLTEDGLTGTDDSWRQTNYYSLDYEAGAGANFADDDMKAWREAPYHVENVVYNHVAVNTMGIRSGIAGSISAPIVAWQPQTYSSTLTTLASHAQRIIQDKNRLSAVVMLINTETGQVVNAAKAPVAPYGQSGIKDTEAHTSGQPLTAGKAYDLQGRQQPSSHKGIYIRNGKKQLR
ncbi:MAG: hypothetical protein IJ243_11255 [Prevotella sp.]|nr:hypothetical protein [Prevotella sp.]